jgi:prefoldin subunit 5
MTPSSPVLPRGKLLTPKLAQQITQIRARVQSGEATLDEIREFILNATSAIENVAKSEKRTDIDFF